MRTRDCVPILLLASVPILCLRLCRAGTEVSGAELVLDRAAAPFVEDEAPAEGGRGRTLAALEARLVSRDGAVRLVPGASAAGPAVDPTPGFEGVRGANLRTARELGALLDGERIALSLQREGAAAEAPALGGALRSVSRGRLPLRRLRPDGTIDWEAESEPVVVALELESAPLPPGRWRAEILIDGRARAAAEVAIQSEGARIEQLTGLDERPRPEQPVEQ